ncbi:hypothetical protein SCP_1700130 [Sparassis crispa]|uniref:Uncharacterized protein n=1 Tax=Sparassis crispa TaxID=139825 RepID=A0A401H5N0_9APHY|nr:hypothetical protein SCP_1700130 [Sparassis crispa]GBE89689.1 hypothetical protein SCP_1700130 [Sparassis crispa]
MTATLPVIPQNAANIQRTSHRDDSQVNGAVVIFVSHSVRLAVFGAWLLGTQPTDMIFEYLCDAVHGVRRTEVIQARVGSLFRDRMPLVRYEAFAIEMQLLPTCREVNAEDAVERVVSFMTMMHRSGERGDQYRHEAVNAERAAITTAMKSSNAEHDGYQSHNYHNVHGLFG